MKKPDSNRSSLPSGVSEAALREALAPARIPVLSTEDIEAHLRPGGDMEASRRVIQAAAHNSQARRTLVEALERSPAPSETAERIGRTLEAVRLLRDHARDRLERLAAAGHAVARAALDALDALLVPRPGVPLAAMRGRSGEQAEGSSLEGSLLVLESEDRATAFIRCESLRASDGWLQGTLQMEFLDPALRDRSVEILLRHSPEFATPLGTFRLADLEAGRGELRQAASVEGDFDVSPALLAARLVP